MTNIFDSHAHYDDKRFNEEFDGGTFAAIEQAHKEGVCGIINVGSNLASSKRSIELAAKYDFIYATVGIHPYDAQLVDPSDEYSVLDEVSRLLSSKKVCALGEIGLDYHYDPTIKDVQMRFFEAQLSIAEEAKLPVIIHSRDAAGDTFDIIRSHPRSFGVFHSYSGSAEMAKQLCDLGWYISFSGPITYKNAAKVKEAAAIVPDDMILIETDSPYLPPTPHRGKLNYSGYLKYTCQALADIRQSDYDSIADITKNNACKLFNIKNK